MKVVIGIVIAALVAAIAVILLVFVLRSHDLVLCGDIPQQSGGNQLYVTRVYTYDVDANSTLTQIIDKMNSNTEGNISATEMTEILSEYQTVVYAPVFTYTLTQEANNTYVLTGSVYNGLDENGDPADTEYGEIIVKRTRFVRFEARFASVTASDIFQRRVKPRDAVSFFLRSFDKRVGHRKAVSVLARTSRDHNYFLVHKYLLLSISA